MMTEIYWKAFLGALILAAILKWGVQPAWSLAALFAGSFLGLAVLLVLACALEGRLEKGKKSGDD